MVHPRYLEHPEDVLAQWKIWADETRVALVAVSCTEGGAVRAVGAVMAVSSDGRVAGYVSGGCIDADVALNAVHAIEQGCAKRLRYGDGSPFKDLPLPCGGAIEITIFPAPDRGAVESCLLRLQNRLPALLALNADGISFTARYTPKLHLRIAGRGAEALALARLAESAGIETTLALRDPEDRSIADATHVVTLETPSSLPEIRDDAWTAFVLMFHEGDWEIPLLRQALAGPAFFVGAVGSQRTHSRRVEALLAAGVSDHQIDRVRGPIGSISSLRDASMLAVSALAEIVAEFHTQRVSPLETTALVLLAAGQSSRYEEGDKLLATFDDKPLMDHAAEKLRDDRVFRRVAIVGPEHLKRQNRLKTKGWMTLVNNDTKQGQGTSLARAATVLQDQPGLEAALVLLADMPCVPESHLRALRAAMEPGVQAVMTDVDGVLGPPALFHRSVLTQLGTLSGDRGARGLFERLDTTRTVKLAAPLAQDVDRVQDLIALGQEVAHG
ncbi:MAG: NTP transferase domain-containing protein [Pseudomonadota bacterium]